MLDTLRDLRHHKVFRWNYILLFPVGLPFPQSRPQKKRPVISYARFHHIS
jgi:hypothetical protein